MHGFAVKSTMLTDGSGVPDLIPLTTSWRLIRQSAAQAVHTVHSHVVLQIRSIFELLIQRSLVACPHILQTDRFHLFNFVLPPVLLQQL